MTKDLTRLGVGLDVLTTVCHQNEATSAQVVGLKPHPLVMRFAEIKY